ncbi:hypothetical protein KDK_73870 [Dictyobacter kobayashii]|uniref:Uncharacterized protein n=1 Tax=Dictyobacter kobayashii TaxID=2014872 RepID=A0A402AWX5_9CHLR|nr:hypothetical protein KDK_73870 [Dictyobacter kobayashii]
MNWPSDPIAVAIANNAPQPALVVTSPFPNAAKNAKPAASAGSVSITAASKLIGSTNRSDKDNNHKKHIRGDSTFHSDQYY